MISALIYPIRVKTNTIIKNLRLSYKIHERRLKQLGIAIIPFIKTYKQILHINPNTQLRRLIDELVKLIN